MSERGSGTPMTMGRRAARRSGPAMSRDQQAVYLELTSMRVSPAAAALMARSQPVRPGVARRLDAAHQADARRAEVDRAARTGAVPGATPANIERTVTKAAVVASANQRTAAVASAAMAAAMARDSALPTPAQSVVRAVTVGGSVDRGGVEEIGGTLVRNVGVAGPWVGRKLRDQVDVSPSGGAMPSGVQGPVAAATTPATSTQGAKPRDLNVTAADALEAIGVLAGVVNPGVAIGLALARRVAARVDNSGMGL